ncbi:MAG: lipoate--protein ligase [Bacteroidales bacterium]|nr:lipoate--protein ligase [Bacteroidales bacterium]
MICIRRNETDPHFNLAAEEYLLKHFGHDCFMLWQNEPSVIIGKHQNARAEVNFPFLNENRIPVIRRISGGGAVYHDRGNLNFSFISSGEKGKLVDFKRFTRPVIAFLQKLNIPAKHEGKNDIRAGGLKISGNAEHVYKNKVLHHGTLLYSTDLAVLSKALKPPDCIFEGRAIPSVRSSVANISDMLKNPPDVDVFREMLGEYLREHLRCSGEYYLETKDTKGIYALLREKYSRWQWNTGYSPEYRQKKSAPAQKGLISSTLSVKNGLIVEIEIEGGKHGSELQKFLNTILQGTRHDEDSISVILAGQNTALEKFGFAVKEIKAILI